MKLLFVDLDGTLLNDQKSIPSQNLEAIQRASQKGHLTVINTGRSFSSAEPYIKQLSEIQPHCYAILYNGGMIYDYTRQEFLYKKTLPLEYVKYIFSQAEKFGIHCQTYEGNYVLAPRDCPEVQEYQEHSQMPVRIDPLLLEHLTEEPVKVLTSNLDNPGLHEEYRRSMAAWAKGKISMFFSNEHYLEHVPEGISKGNAILKLCGLLNVPLSHTYAAGDAENDLTMLQTAATGIAMANGTPLIKKTADYITKQNHNQGGIAEIIEKFIEN